MAVLQVGYFSHRAVPGAKYISSEIRTTTLTTILHYNERWTLQSFLLLLTKQVNVHVL